MSKITQYPSIVYCFCFVCFCHGAASAVISPIFAFCRNCGLVERFSRVHYYVFIDSVAVPGRSWFGGSVQSIDQMDAFTKSALAARSKSKSVFCFVRESESLRNLFIALSSIFQNQVLSKRQCVINNSSSPSRSQHQLELDSSWQCKQRKRPTVAGGSTDCQIEHHYGHVGLHTTSGEVDQLGIFVSHFRERCNGTSATWWRVNKVKDCESVRVLPRLAPVTVYAVPADDVTKYCPHIGGTDDRVGYWRCEIFGLWRF